jgi:hypothetical protein
MYGSLEQRRAKAEHIALAIDGAKQAEELRALVRRMLSVGVWVEEIRKEAARLGCGEDDR